MTASTDQRRAAVLGTPISHSLSPLLHTIAYRSLGLTGWRYDAIECDEPQLAGFLAELGNEWVGVSLTMPLKRAALGLADEVAGMASAVGAANTLLFDNGTIRADNTDVAGVVGALREAGTQRVDSAVILGAGGTAQAALVALRELGLTTPTVVVRDTSRSTDLRETADRIGARPRIIGGLGEGPLPRASVVVSALPFGAADALELAADSQGCVVLDVVYAPWPTRFAMTARRRGAQVVGGLAMLLHQAAAQVQLMTGRPAPVEAMREALHRAVAERSGADADR